MLTKTLLMVEPAFQISQALLGPLPLVIPLKIVVVCTDSAPIAVSVQRGPPRRNYRWMQGWRVIRRVPLLCALERRREFDHATQARCQTDGADRVPPG
jgi:hypothetical protein